MNGGRESADERDAKGDEHGCSQDGQVNGNRVHSRNDPGGGADEQAHARKGERNAERGTGSGYQQTLGEGDARKLPGTGAERQPDGQVALAGHGATDQERGHVPAGHEQDQDGCRHERVEDRTDLPEKDIVEGPQLGRASVCGRHLRKRPLRIVARLFDAHTILEPADQPEGAGYLPARRQVDPAQRGGWNPGCDVLRRKPELRRHDCRYVKAAVARHDRAAEQQRGVLPRMGGRQPAGENHPLVGIGCRGRAAGARGHAKDLEERRRDQARPDETRLANAANGQLGDAVGPRRLERADTALPILDLGQRDPELVPVRRMERHDDNARRFRAGEWPKQHAVGDGKDRGVDAGAKSDCENSGESDCGRCAKCAKTARQVAKERAHAVPTGSWVRRTTALDTQSAEWVHEPFDGTTSWRFGEGPNSHASDSSSSTVRRRNCDIASSLARRCWTRSLQTCCC